MSVVSSKRLRLLSCLSGGLLLTALLCLFGPRLSDAAADSQKAPPKDNPKQIAKPAALGGTDRYLTHVSTDKPIYRENEKVYIRGVLLEAHSRKPAPKRFATQATIEILGPKGDVVGSGRTNIQESTVGYAWKIPAGQSGGEYTAKVSYPWLGLPPAERKFDIRAYRAPRLKSQIEFIREGYGPGDKVSANVKVERAEGGIPVDAVATVRALVDGQTVHESKTVVDPTGIAAAQFELPKKMERGEGTLSFTIEDGGVVDTAAKTIPILLQTVDVNFYPEGGDLIAGIPNRVYVSAKTPAQKPADISGEIVDASMKVVGSFETVHEGRGRVTFTPKLGESYTLRITKPSGIGKAFPLPEIHKSGVTLQSPREVIETTQDVPLIIHSTDSQKLSVSLRQREKLVVRKTIETVEGKASKVNLDPQDASGVLVVTVEDANGTPLAERLVFREPKSGLKVKIEADKEKYTPGGTANLTIHATNADGEPVSAIVGVTVTDDSVLEMIETRDQQPRLPVMAFFENDVQDLADAHIYLDQDDPLAASAVDLLLGTQGWRRFAFYNSATLVKEHGDDARRVLALTIPTPRPFMRFRAAGAIGGAVEAEALELPQAAAAAIEVGEAPADKVGDASEIKKFADGPVGEKMPAKKPQAERPPAPPAENADAAPEQKQLRQQLGKAIAADRAATRRLLKPGANRVAGGFGAAPFVVVREFAHKVRANRQPGERVDFTETLYWHAGVRTDAETGIAKIAFDLSDAVTSFQVSADAFDESGNLYAATQQIQSVEPYYVEPKLPLEVTTGDTVLLPLGLVNSTSEVLSNVNLTVNAEGLTTTSFDPFVLSANQRVRRVLPLEVGRLNGTSQLVISTNAGPYQDQVTRPLVIVPQGFPVELAHGGMLYSDETKSHEIEITETVVPGSLTTKFTVFPTPMASLTAALERLIREPYGCFEQTSSTTYPLVMAGQYFQTHAGVDPELIQRSQAILAKGYDRLIGFECKSGGFEWFGEDPGHEALTAYGLLEFSDMAQVRDVDPEMLARTSQWLMGRRDGEGHFIRERRALHTWLADQDVSDAYITWALLSSGMTGLDKEVDTVGKDAQTNDNSYVVALAANVLVLADQKSAAQELLDKLVTLQAIDGSIDGASKSIVGSGGEALKIEATALATLAWLSNPDYIDFADKGVKYLASVCEDGRFGNTQSTVLALKAIVEFDKARAKPKADGSVQLLVDGQPFGDPVPFTKETRGEIKLPDFATKLTPGKHTIAVQMTDGSSMPYAVTVNFNEVQPQSNDNSPLQMQTSLSRGELQEGAATELRVRCENTSDETVPTPVAIVGLPGGFEVRHDQLKELVSAKKVAAYEVRGRDVILYWRAMEAGQEVDLSLSCIASIPGSYTGPASRIYPYYSDDQKFWVKPISATISAIE
ncbi:MG2 domain-containing protein [Thalassoroseus pseudoceratinae]|uniref:MG2 domain-containing protein n=1 Tax=Thalassoroseus pseudoceratinae TaxID=2713176 RepID=UPI001423A7D6|nr:MG2 domain-containing protein [Thalassoroseus pseudoceratinae]